MNFPSDRIIAHSGELLPPMLADFECRHGRIRDCEECAWEREQWRLSDEDARYRDGGSEEVSEP